ncbi:MAG: NADH dehydrogenase FAD-containing subunit [Desulfobacteraceae bacterium]|nr:MAG: NADH dehydrogenase FAD-containing subunit [Desulfobacteraceae bacterium]
MIWALILVPAAAGALSFLPLPERMPRMLLISAATLHLVLSLAAWYVPGELTAAGGWLAVDAAGLLFLTICSALFLAAALYALGYLSETKEPIRDYLEGFDFGNRPEGVFIGCLLLFLATMSAVALAHHLGLLWVAVEATTLASAPLIYYHRHHRSLSAAWKYLLICSVGIALALLGNFFLAVATTAAKGQHITLLIPVLMDHAAALQPTWLKAAFLLMLVGYGTKMGLAPMHTWLPDAHSEAPSLVSALLSGALLNCAFLAVLRMQAVLAAAGMGAFGRDLLVLFGLLSMAWAALLLIAQADYKRLLAYSSVEHMGVLAVGVGLGGVAGAGAMLHAVNHSLAKAALFLVAGNILAAYRTKDILSTWGVRHILPLSGMLWLAGILAVAGSPPFGLFTSELMILQGALADQRWAVAGGYLAALGVAFGALLWAALKMVYGTVPAGAPGNKPRGDTFFSVASPAFLTAAVLLLGFWVPDPLWRLVHKAAALWGGTL